MRDVNKMNIQGWLLPADIETAICRKWFRYLHEGKTNAGRRRGNKLNYQMSCSYMSGHKELLCHCLNDLHHRKTRAKLLLLLLQLYETAKISNRKLKKKCFSHFKYNSQSFNVGWRFLVKIFSWEFLCWVNRTVKRPRIVNVFFLSCTVNWCVMKTTKKLMQQHRMSEFNISLALLRTWTSFVSVNI